MCIEGLVLCVEGLVLCAEGLVLCIEVVAGYHTVIVFCGLDICLVAWDRARFKYPISPPGDLPKG